jgi:hypothetical protein
MLRHTSIEYRSERHRLLKTSEIAPEVWNEERAEICRCRLIGKETADETPPIAGEVREGAQRIAEP